MKIGKYQFRYQIIKLVHRGRYTALDAAWELNLSIRHVRRLLAVYRANKRKSKKLSFALVAPKPRSAWNAIEQKIANEAVKLKKENEDRSCQRIAELVQDTYLTKIARSTVRKILIKHGCYVRPKRERRVFLKLEERITKCGQMVQFDVTEGAWLKGYRRVYLIAFMDAYSRYIVGWQWVASNSAWNNILVLRSVASEYGVPEMFYTDNASFYKVIRHNKSIYQDHKPDDEYETTMQRIILDLGSVMVNHKPYQPQGKGRIERFFRTMQERFIAEHTAKTIEELNDQFKVWITWYHTKHVIRTSESTPKNRFNSKEFKPVPKNLDLEQVFSYQYTRKVDKYNSFSFEGASYFIDSENCKHWNGTLAHCTVNLYVSETKVIVYHGERKIQEFDKVKTDVNDPLPQPKKI